MSDPNDQALVGSEVYSSDGSNVGKVESIESDGSEGSFLHVKENGLFGIGAENFLVPVDAITSSGDGKVTVNKSAEDMVGIPAHDSHAPNEGGYFNSIYAWWWRADEN